MLYLDYCATTPLHEEVANTIADVMRKHYGNPSSLHHLGLEAERLVIKAREVIAEALHCRPGRLCLRPAERRATTWLSKALRCNTGKEASI
ncbi:aminotransferase class V-fold PLP-dependent enzyme [Paenibacillus sp. CC-CFT747]|nr:aminotransferase class V-fold PLP-dependent enzyme [Paenibacillus sp. CC-CFT747]